MKTKLLLPLLTLAGLLAVPAMAQVNYAVSGGTAYVTNSPNAAGDIVIASTYNGYPVTSIGNGAFGGCASLRNVVIPDSVTTISDGAFYNCTSLTSVTIGNSATNIGNQTFYNCSSLTSVTIPNSVISIGYLAYYNCTSLTSVMIPNSVTNIGHAALYNCTSLTSVTIPNSVTSIGAQAFFGCTSLTNFSVDAANSVYSSLNGVLFNKAQTILLQFPEGRGGTYVIPDSITVIEALAFYNCTSLTNLTIPNSVTSIEAQAFWNCTSLTNVTVAADNPAYSSIGGVLFDKAQTTLIQFPGGRGGSYVIPNSVTSIWQYAFYVCSSLTSVTIPNRVTYIWDNAFFGCTSLTNITVAADNPAYSSIGGVLFNKTQTILIRFPGGRGGSCVIPNSVTSIGYGAFENCTSLMSVTIGNSVTSIGYSAFYNCASLTNLSVDAANSDYSSLNGICFNKAQTILIRFPGGRGGPYVIPDSVTVIVPLAFYNCTSLMNVTIGNSVAAIGDLAFYNCTSLSSLTFLGNMPYLIPGEWPTYESYAFENVGAGATVYYYYGTAGWGPTYGGLPAVMLGATAPQVSSGSAGVQPGGFGFTITGVVNQTIVVEASTNLANWQPIWTNTPSAGSASFVDPQWLNHPHRFYRLRSAQ